MAESKHKKKKKKRVLQENTVDVRPKIQFHDIIVFKYGLVTSVWSPVGSNPEQNIVWLCEGAEKKQKPGVKMFQFRSLPI